jgi:hypothetical protein
MNTKVLGMIAVLVGVVLLLVSVLADYIGLGGAPGFGTRQIIGALAGAIVALAGFVVMRKK